MSGTCVDCEPANTDFMACARTDGAVNTTRAGATHADRKSTVLCIVKSSQGIVKHLTNKGCNGTALRVITNPKR